MGFAYLPRMVSIADGNTFGMGEPEVKALPVKRALLARPTPKVEWKEHADQDCNTAPARRDQEGALA